MKKFAVLIILMAMSATNAMAACSATTKTYSSCKPGYYMQTIFDINGGTSTSSCIRCPSVTGANGETVYGTSPDRNTDSEKSCVLPAGTYTDATGTYKIDGGECKYSSRFGI